MFIAGPCWCCVRPGLRDGMLPSCAPLLLLQVEVSMGEDDEPEIELSGEREGAPLNVQHVPVIVSVSQVYNTQHCCTAAVHHGGWMPA